MIQSFSENILQIILVLVQVINDICEKSIKHLECCIYLHIFLGIDKLEDEV